VEYIILFKSNVNYDNTVYLNILLENLKKHKENRIILIYIGKVLKESIFFSEEKIDEIVKINSFISFVKNTYRFNKGSKRIIISLSKNFLFKFYGNLIFKKRLFLEIKNFDFNSIENKSIIKRIIPKIKPLEIIKNPKIYVNNKKLTKALEYINWCLKNSKQKKINEIRYLYLLLKSENANEFHHTFKKLQKKINNKNNLNIIVTFLDYNKDILKGNFSYLNSKLKERILGNEFINSDKNFIVALIKNSDIFITDNHLYLHYAELINKNTLLLENSQGTDEINNELESKLQFLIKSI
tara:strand:+ start:347 stop:1237 length:891 start_codon:yes stop_codon:yes gene_type:complete